MSDVKEKADYQIIEQVRYYRPWTREYQKWSGLTIYNRILQDHLPVQVCFKLYRSQRVAELIKLKPSNILGKCLSNFDAIYISNNKCT